MTTLNRKNTFSPRLFVFYAGLLLRAHSGFASDSSNDAQDRARAFLDPSAVHRVIVAQAEGRIAEASVPRSSTSQHSPTEIPMTAMKNFVVIAEHPPQLCPHSNAAARKIMQRIPEIQGIAKKLGIEVIFSGIPVPEHQTIMILRAPSFEAVRTFMVETNFVQINTITIRQTESVEEFFNETKESTPLF